MPGVLQRARQDLADDQLWRARSRLEGFVGSKGYHRDVLELLGEVCWRMGDAPAAGRFWFFTVTDTNAKRNAVEQFVRLCNGDPHQIASRLPRKLRSGPSHRYPPEVQNRLKVLSKPILENPKRRLQRRRVPAARSKSADTLAFAALAAIAIFFLYCFSLGLKQILAAM